MEKKSNVFTAAVDGFFDFISTGSAIVDNIIRRLVSFAVLLWVLLFAVSSLGNNVYVSSQVVGSAISLAVEGIDEATTLSPENKQVFDEVKAEAEQVVKVATDKVGLTDPDPVPVSTEVVSDVPIIQTE